MNTLSEQSATPPSKILQPKERTCPRCGGSSLDIPFYVRKNGRLSTNCIACEKIVVMQRYEEKKKALSKLLGKPCKCGCGEFTSVAVVSDASRGIKAGDALDYINGHSTRLSPVEYVEEDRGYKTRCWIWQRAKDKDGYGFITIAPRASGSRSGRAHVVYYERKYGPIPEGLFPDHLCRVPSCVNPDHIEPVTIAENTRRGLSAKLTAVDVSRILQMLAVGTKQEEIAAKFGITQTMVSRIKRGKAWMT